MKSITVIVVGLFWLVIGLQFVLTTAKLIALRSSSSRWAWLRKLYWKSIRDSIIKDVGMRNFKLGSYFGRYMKQSIAIKIFFIRHGYIETRFALIAKVEELERDMDKWQFNSFDKLSWEQEMFIDAYLKSERRKNL